MSERESIGGGSNGNAAGMMAAIGSGGEWSSAWNGTGSSSLKTAATTSTASSSGNRPHQQQQKQHLLLSPNAAPGSIVGGGSSSSTSNSIKNSYANTTSSNGNGNGGAGGMTDASNTPGTNALSATSPSTSTGGPPANINENDKVYWLIVELLSPNTREAALLELSKKREQWDDLALVLWHSFGGSPSHAGVS